MKQLSNKTNWTLPPHNRWSFQRVDKFTRTVRVPRAAAASLIDENPADLSQITFIDTSGKQTTVDDMLARTFTDGFLVMHNGGILTEQYFNGMDRSTLHLMMSCSKSFTAAIAGIYVESGHLDPAAEIVTYLTELSDTGVAGATVQHALDMQVGVVFDENYENLNADWCDYELATGWRESAGYDGPKSQLEFARTLQSDGNDHGSVFHYQSVLTNLVGGCLERAVGKRFTEMLAEHVWDPMGAEQDFVAIVDSSDAVSFEGGFNVCLRDFARFGQLIANGGRQNGRQLLSESWINRCRHPGNKLIMAFAASRYAEFAPGGAYHNGWWVRNPARGVLVGLGINGQALFIDHEKDFVAAKFSSQPENENDAMELDQVLAFEAIAATVCGTET